MNELRILIIEGTEGTGPFRGADILIDGNRLIDILKRIESPYAKSEGSPEVAGEYLSLSVATTLLPSRHFLGEPRRIFVHDEKVAILICTCGCEGCWDFVCHMEFSESVVTWSRFEQVHRNWDYSELGTFTFDRKNYEAQFSQHSAELASD